MNKVDKNDWANLSDEQVFAESLRQPVLFEIIVNRYKKPFLRKATPIISPISSLETAEDAVQEAFVKMYIKGKSFTSRGEGSFRSWAYSILMNTCFSVYRKARRENNVSLDENEEMIEMIPDTARFEEKKISFDYVLSMISRLPETLRRTAELYFVKEKSHSEIASLEKTTEGAIRTRVHRVRNFIQKQNQVAEQKND